MGIKHVTRILWKWLAITILSGLCVLFLRQFVVGSYQISTDAMLNALQRGDYILVQKCFSWQGIQRNRIVLFTSPLATDSLASPILISRIVGLPGDTIEVNAQGYRINGQAFSRSPLTVSSYRVGASIQPQVAELMKRFSIPHRSTTASLLRLTDFEVYQLREELSPEEQSQLTLQSAIATDYQLVVPMGHFWVLGDNTTAAVDSRYVGFIPADHIVGIAFFCWYSHDPRRILKSIY